MPDEITSPLIFIVGGTGFSAAQALLQSALFTKKTTQPITLCWGIRELSDFYAEAEINHWLATYSNVHFQGYLSESQEQHPQFSLGYPFQDLETLLSEKSHEAILELYVFGPPTLVKATWQHLSKHADLNKIHFHADFPAN